MEKELTDCLKPQLFGVTLLCSVLAGDPGLYANLEGAGGDQGEEGS